MITKKALSRRTRRENPINNPKPNQLDGLSDDIRQNSSIDRFKFARDRRRFNLVGNSLVQAGIESSYLLKCLINICSSFIGISTTSKLFV
ncbi:uncharacterized protein OCT59_023548 [Rhizophagus irregularis]|uniref:uncharacterized protein n=1 Tax=Rhizophagus irregularis TaxID=588596 RepID=UPI001A04AADD|nr:hypothetical protein OCT59_023548 [Rhizophagus irregularis]GET58291.1 hypothetical protein RIR_jg39436.t1 [Rhizophagus irregularis DAOM 181602=DAOM 197198]